MDKTIANEIREAKQKEWGKKKTTKVTYCLITKEWVAKHATNRDEGITFIATWLQLLRTLKIVCTKVSK